MLSIDLSASKPKVISVKSHESMSEYGSTLSVKSKL